MKKANSRMHTIDANFLGFAVPVIWERNERRIKTGGGTGTKVFQINGVLHIDGNILLSDLERVLPAHTLGKLKLNYTGDVPLSHPREDELIQNMLKNARAAYKVVTCALEFENIYHPSCKRSTRSPPAMPHCRTACKIQNGCQGAKNGRRGP